jgi:hypothetical protein
MSEVKLADSEWEQFCDGPNATVWMHSECLRVFRLFQIRDQAKIESTMRDMYCSMENASIPKERFNLDEGRHDQLLVKAFKAKQSRVYGVQGSVNGKRTFFATNAATKKTNKADQSELSKAARLAKNIGAFVDGAKV